MYKTKSGKEIAFDVKEHFETNNSGWDLHKIDAYVDEHLVGYLKISYIPKSRFEETYSTFEDYLTKKAGYHASNLPPDAFVLKGLREQFERFRKFHTDKPMVDYIRLVDFPPRQHVGISLYHFGAFWLAKNYNLALHASGLQSNEAKSVWDYMQNTLKYPIFPESDPADPAQIRLKLDFTSHKLITAPRSHLDFLLFSIN